MPCDDARMTAAFAAWCRLGLSVELVCDVRLCFRLAPSVSTLLSQSVWAKNSAAGSRRYGIKCDPGALAYTCGMLSGFAARDAPGRIPSRRR